ncbi:hypothetical protein [Kribbella sp. CA-247076]|uniref:hypothetical protein n=1 Tax=Kribbella sp. CA-247076 TaxID=3239941 RepID=UPI003D9351A4
MIRQLAAVAAAATLLVTTLPAAQAAVAGPASPATCTKKVLDLPADSLGSGSARSADPSGRYILGQASREGRMHNQAVLWVDGVPRWLASQPDGETFAYSVIKGGFVLGTTYGDTTQHWIYSARSDSYRILDLGDVQYPEVSAMNENRDVLGTVLDPAGQRAPFVWPASGQPRQLPMPNGHSVESMDDISADGLVVGRLNLPEGGGTSFLWRPGQAQPTRLTGAGDERVWAREIQGRWIAGGNTDLDNPTGLLWNTRHNRTVRLEAPVADLNSSRDAVTSGLFGPLGDRASTLIRRDGTKLTFPEGTMLEHIFERGTQWTAAGYDVSSSPHQPLVYACE